MTVPAPGPGGSLGFYLHERPVYALAPLDWARMKNLAKQAGGLAYDPTTHEAVLLTRENRQLAMEALADFINHLASGVWLNPDITEAEALHIPPTTAAALPPYLGPEADDHEAHLQANAAYRRWEAGLRAEAAVREMHETLKGC